MRCAWWLVALVALPACDFVFGIADAPDGGGPPMDIARDPMAPDMATPIDADPLLADFDGDGIPNGSDLCPLTYSLNNADSHDDDGVGDACDPDENTKQTPELIVFTGTSTSRFSPAPSTDTEWGVRDGVLVQTDTGRSDHLDVYSGVIAGPTTITAMYEMATPDFDDGRRPRAGIYIAENLDNSSLPVGVECVEERHLDPDLDGPAIVGHPSVGGDTATAFNGAPSQPDHFITFSLGAFVNEMTHISCRGRRAPGGESGIEENYEVLGAHFGLATNAASAKFRAVFVATTVSR